MKVAELIKILEKLPKNVDVCFLDTYWESEGYGPYANEREWNRINSVEYDEDENIVEIE